MLSILLSLRNIARLVLAGMLALSVDASAEPLTQSIATSGAKPVQRTSAFDEPETVIVPAPGQAVAYTLPTGMTVVDYEVAPAGNTVALVIETAAHRQQLAFWQFDGQKLARSLDIPAGTRIASLAWHPQGKDLFLLESGGGAGSGSAMRTTTSLMTKSSIIPFLAIPSARPSSVVLPPLIWTRRPSCTRCSPTSAWVRAARWKS